MAECVEWSGYKNSDGYGERYFEGRKERVHRAAWIEAHGPIPAETPCVLHRCDNRACYNLDHLFLGTNADNVVDRVAKGREADHRGEKNGFAKLSWEIVNEMRQRYSPHKVTQKQLAEEYGVSILTVNRIIRKVTWVS